MYTAPALSFVPMAVHIGEAIERRRKATGMSKTDLAARIGKDRTHIYTLIESPSIDTLLLKQVCEALQFNFFKLLAEDMEPDMHTFGYAPGPDMHMIAAEPAAPYTTTEKKRAGVDVTIHVDPSDPSSTEKLIRALRSITGG